MCSTGRASGTWSGAQVPRYTWMCPWDIPRGAAPLASGQYCYDTLANCNSAANVRQSIASHATLELRCRGFHNSLIVHSFRAGVFRPTGRGGLRL